MFSAFATPVFVPLRVLAVVEPADLVIAGTYFAAAALFAGLAIVHAIWKSGSPSRR